MYKLLIIMLFISISANAQESADCVGVYDDVGTRFGRTIPGDGPSLHAFFVEVDGVVIAMEVLSNRIRAGSRISFTDSTCSSAPFLPVPNKTPVSGVAALIGQTLYYADTTISQQSIGINSFRSTETGICESEFNPTGDGLPALQATFPQRIPPFHLEVEPCFPEGIINGCVKSNGTLRIVDDAESCMQNETLISWVGLD